MKKLGIFLLAVMLAVPGMASAADRLPKGFIAMSESEMTWGDAKAWCEQQGGKLPLIGGSSSLRDVPRDPSTDGFGYVGGPGSSGLPSGPYWTGTEVANNPGYSWIVVDDNGLILSHRRQSNQGRVVCVPSMAAAADRLPKGFTAMSESGMIWAEAKAFCRQHGGRLPLIGGTESLGSSDAYRQGVSIDGFGARGSPWPSGLPGTDFWTGTEYTTALPDSSWGVSFVGGKVNVGIGPQSLQFRAVCVPL